MKAIVYTTYRSPDVLEMGEVQVPTPKDDQVLVKIHAASLNYGDAVLVSGKPFIARLMGYGLLKPKHEILGTDIAGEVESVGANVKRFQPGDPVFGDIGDCGFGAFAEYVAVPVEALIRRPSNLTFEQAAAVPQAAVIALQGLRDEGGIRRGQKVLIYGASGGVGTFAVQIAKSFGAEVTAVCSTRHLDRLRSIGADHVIDYTQEDFTQNEVRYDLIIAANGYHPIADYKRALNPQGVYVCTGGSLTQIFQSMLLGPLMSRQGSKQLTNLNQVSNHKDLVSLQKMLAAGDIIPVIDRSYQLNQVADAFRYFGEGHAQGKVVITMEHNSN